MKNKKILCIILTLTILMTSLVYPNNSVKAETKTYENLEYGENSDGTIYIKRLLNRTTVTEVTIPEQIEGQEVTSIIGEFATPNKGEVVALKRITIPKTVKSIGTDFYGAFTNAENLEEIIVDPNSPYFCSINGVLYNKDKTKLVAYPANKKDTTYTILNGVTQINSYAFSFSNNLSQVTIPNTVETLQDCSFAQSSITSLIIPESVKSLGSDTFYKCANLKTVELNCDAYVDLYEFFECKNLTDVTICKDITLIRSYAFMGCTKLKNVNFETSGLVDIDYNAFMECPSLPRSIKLPNTIKELNKTAFDSDVQINFTGTDMVETTDEWEKCIKIKVDGTMDYTEAYKVFDLVNQERQKQNLSLLKLDKNLTDIAMQRAYEISVYFAHRRPEVRRGFAFGSSSYDAMIFKEDTLYIMGLQNENINAYGENIASGYVNATEVMNGWMNSSGHKANILSTNFTSVGIGAIKTENGIYWVQIFGDGNYTEENKRSNKTETRFVPVSTSYITDFKGEEGVTLTSNKTTINVKGTTNIRVKSEIKYANATTYLEQSGFNWSSSNEQVLQVDQNGNVTGVSGGTADVIMTMSDGSTRKITITVMGLKGDMDKSGEVTTIDALLANSIFESGKKPTEEELQIGDINGDDNITTIDALMINNAFETKTPLK